MSKDDTAWSPQTIRLTPVENQEASFLCDSLTKLHSRKISACKLVNRKNLQHENSGRVTLFVELSTQGLSEFEYKPGDHVGIVASNRRELVDSLLSKITNAPPPDQLIKIELLKEKTTVFGTTSQWTVDERYPPFTLRTALTNYLDITSPVTQNMLLYLSTQSATDTDRVNLERLAKDHVAYEEWKINGWPNLVEVLDEFASVKPNASLLITQLPKLQPRFYSISSSPKQSDNIHLTVGLVEYKPVGKATHYGVCSKWLDELAEGQVVPTFVRG
jgi:nitric-oxide synthase